MSIKAKTTYERFVRKARKHLYYDFGYKEAMHKVREAIKKARISSMTHKCPKCHELVWTTTREEVVSYIVLLRELCLDDEVKE